MAAPTCALYGGCKIYFGVHYLQVQSTLSRWPAPGCLIFLLCSRTLQQLLPSTLEERMWKVMDLGTWHEASRLSINRAINGPELGTQGGPRGLE